MLALAQESDEGNAVLQTERDLATAYLKSDTDGIAQGVMEDYTLTNSMGKITTRADDIAKQRKRSEIRNLREFRHESAPPWRHRSCDRKNAHKRSLQWETF